MKGRLSRSELFRAERALVRASDSAAGLSFALACANTYFVGMSSLATHSVWRILADDSRFRCERVFWDGLEEEPQSLESGRRLGAFDVIGFSLSFEPDYARAVQMLQAARVAPLSADRGPDAPLVIAGGVAVSANPAPVADIFDAILIGEAEDVLPRALDVIAVAASRVALLEGLAAVPGFYVPAVHGPRTEDGAGPATVEKQIVRDLDGHDTASAILTPHTEFADCFLIEVERGCGRGCRFCLAGHIYRPHRQRRVETIVRLGEVGLQHTDRVGLIGAALSDYAEIDALVTALRERGARISTSSLRAESVTPRLLQALVESGQRQITLAPEAGTQRLRGVLGKRATDRQFEQAAAAACEAGIRRCKLYFMFGLPTETEDDLQAIGDFAARLEKDFRGLRVTVSAAPFVPKAHTPFQWEPMPELRDLQRRARRVREVVRSRSKASLRIESPQWARVQAVLSRGGRELGAVIVQAAQRGGNAAAFRRALSAHGVRPEAPFEAPDPGTPLPWDFIAGAPEKSSLWRQRERSLG